MDRPPTPPGVDALTEFVTCPECGTTARVTLNRRDATDFCRKCDYPLFWVPQRILTDRSALVDDSLRRLPGTVGRATVASVACPHCAEPNHVSATVCVRCGRLMHIVEPPPPPPPVPVYVAPPPVVIEPEPGVPWWLWLLVGLVIAAVVVLATLYFTGTIG